MDTALIDPAAKTVALPYHQQLAALVPHKTLKRRGLMVVPHTHDVTRLARNLGLKVPAPIMSYYDWNGDKPFHTQKITAAMLTMQRRAFVLSQMGTGKTRAALYALDFERREGLVHATLVVAPLSTLSTVWDREIFKYFNHLSVGVLHGSRALRLEILEQPHDVYVINHDGVKTILPALMERKDIDCVIVDELASFRNARTDRWKALSQLCNREYVWGMTGSPTPNEPADAYAQIKLLAPKQVPKFFKTFKEMTMTQVSTFRWIPRKDAQDTVFNAMQPGVRFTRDDCVELPPVSFAYREVALSPEQQRIYKEMMSKLRVAFATGEVTAANEGVLMSKLLQITTGFAYTKGKAPVEIDHAPRMEALMELLDEAEGKVLVFVDFVYASQMVASELAKAGYSVAQVSGDTPKHLRDLIFAEFQSAASPRIIVAHPKCMSHGLTLTAASLIVWYSPTTSPETYEQACARITRPGQTRKQLIMHLTGTSIESKLYKRLQQKASLQGALLEMFE
jgi:SNF2 family DNA or RNA helicase